MKPDFFEEGSPFLNHPLLTAERTGSEVSFLAAQLNLTPGSVILDIGCGFGRHSIELASRGFDVVGIDPSAAMISAARERASAAGVTPEFLQAAGESFSSSRELDAAICLFTTLGQHSQHGDNRALVRSAFDALRPGGQFVVEIPQREPFARALKPADRFGDQQHYTNITRTYSPTDHVVTERFELVSPSQTRTYLLRYRLFDAAELQQLLKQAGFTVTAHFSGYEPIPLSSDSPTMLFIGRK